MTLSIKALRIECNYAECRILFITLKVVMLSVVMSSVVAPYMIPQISYNSHACGTNHLYGKTLSAAGITQAENRQIK